MDRRIMPGLGRPVSRLILGMSAAPDELPSLYDRFVELGGNAIDTARWYTEEPVLGAWLSGRPDRDELVIVGKGAHPATQDGPQRVSPRAIKEDLLGSLERLRTDWIDVFLLHRDDESVPVGVIMTALAEHREDGRIRAAAGSNWSTDRLAEANAWALANGLPGFDASSPNLSLAVPTRPPWPDCRTAGDSASLAWYERTQLPLFAWAPLARGYFGPSPAEDDVAANEAFDSPANRTRCLRARELAAELGLTATQVALAWVLSQPFPTWAVIGARTVAELEECALATSLHLTAEQVRWLSSG